MKRASERVRERSHSCNSEFESTHIFENVYVGILSIEVKSAECWKLKTLKGQSAYNKRKRRGWELAQTYWTFFWYWTNGSSWYFLIWSRKFCRILRYFLIRSRVFLLISRFFLLRSRFFLLRSRYFLIWSRKFCISIEFTKVYILHILIRSRYFLIRSWEFWKRHKYLLIRSRNFLIWSRNFCRRIL